MYIAFVVIRSPTFNNYYNCFITIIILVAALYIYIYVCVCVCVQEEQEIVFSVYSHCRAHYVKRSFLFLFNVIPREELRELFTTKPQ